MRFCSKIEVGNSCPRLQRPVLLYRDDCILWNNLLLGCTQLADLQAVRWRNEGEERVFYSGRVNLAKL